MKKLSLTIGIPAYNEADNINKLLRDIQKQNKSGYVLKKVIVYSDGSTDETVKKAREVRSDFIKIYEGKRRRGKVVRQNQIIKFTSTDALLILDADIRIRDKYAIGKLISNIKNGYDLVSCPLVPLEQKNLIQRIVAHYIKFQNQVIADIDNGDSVYTCHGPIRIFSKKLYSNILFPKTVGEDAYSYFYCKTKGYKYFYDKSTSVCIQLPSVLKDHMKQSTRFVHSKKSMENLFGENIVKGSYKTSSWFIFKKQIVMLFKDPLYFSMYVAIYIYSRIISKYKKATTIFWDISASSKLNLGK